MAYDIIRIGPVPEKIGTINERTHAVTSLDAALTDIMADIEGPRGSKLSLPMGADGMRGSRGVANIGRGDAGYLEALDDQFRRYGIMIVAAL